LEWKLSERKWFDFGDKKMNQVNQMEANEINMNQNFK